MLRSLLKEILLVVFESYIRTKWDGISTDIDAPLKEKMKSDLFGRILSSEDYENKRKGQTLRTIGRIATGIAAVAAFVLCSVLSYRYALATHPSQSFNVVAEQGQKSSVTLPDGSRVWLNSASRISYASDFNDRNRNIELEGEAYFEVAKNADLPFVVNAGAVRVEALGTKFNVKAYIGEDEITTTLVEGKVLTSAGQRREILLPNQQALYSITNNTFTTSIIPHANHPVPWRNNELFFDDNNLRQIATILERMYNVEIIFSDIRNETIPTPFGANNFAAQCTRLGRALRPSSTASNGNTIKFFRRN